jgi:hypothetical protein
MECDFSIAHHIKNIIRGMSTSASMQPSEYSKKDFKTKLQKKSKTTSKVLEKPAVLSYEELGGLSDPGPRDCVDNVA